MQIAKKEYLKKAAMLFTNSNEIVWILSAQGVAKLQSVPQILRHEKKLLFQELKAQYSLHII